MQIVTLRIAKQHKNCADLLNCGMFKWLCCILFFYVATVATSCRPEEPPDDLVFDNAMLLSAQQADSLNMMLNRFKRESGAEFMLYTTERLYGATIDDLSEDITQSLGLGKRELNNGALILISYEERQIRISIQHGLEWQIPDEEAAAIRDALSEDLSNENFYVAFKKGFAMLYEEINTLPWEVNYESFQAFLAEKDDALNKIVAIKEYSLPKTVSMTARGNKQFSEEQKLLIYGSNGEEIILYHSMYMMWMVEDILNKKAGTIYARAGSATEPYIFYLLGIANE